MFEGKARAGSVDGAQAAAPAGHELERAPFAEITVTPARPDLDRYPPSTSSPPSIWARRWAAPARARGGGGRRQPGTRARHTPRPRPARSARRALGGAPARRRHVFEARGIPGRAPHACALDGVAPELRRGRPAPENLRDRLIGDPGGPSHVSWRSFRRPGAPGRRPSSATSGPRRARWLA